jgi:phage terminase large subunit
MTDLPIEQRFKLLKLLIIENRLRMPEKMKAFRLPVRYKFAHGGRGGGKSESIAKLLLDMASKEKKRILCAREIQNSIADSVYSLLKDMIYNLEYPDFQITESVIRNTKTGSEFIFAGLYNQKRTQSIKSLAGIDICWIEEAQALSEDSFKLIDPTIRKENSEIWCSYNRLFPDDPVELFKNRLPDADKVDVLINYYDNPYLPEVLRKQAELSKYEFDNGLSEDYPHIWLGDPVGLSEKTIIPLREAEKAMTREVSAEGCIEIGADIARYGSDRTVLVKRKGLRMIDLKVFKGLSVVEVENRIKEFADYDRTVPIKVDDTGVGGGVTDILKADGYNAIPINNGESAMDSDRYPNAISEMWFNLKDILPTVQLINHSELKSELITREFDLDTKGRRCVESKEKYKKRFGKSPDLADALLLAFYKGNKKSNVMRAISGL